jgi:signal transduction histidine kinase
MKKNESDERVLIMAPFGNDAPVMADVLAHHGFGTHVCGSPAECCAQMNSGAGALLITEEVLEFEGALNLLEALKAQPPWSELPLIILTTSSESRVAWLLERAADAAGSLILLERPIGTTTLLRSVEVALNSRRRQYEIRNLVAALADSSRALEQRVRDRTRELRAANAKLKAEIERRKGLEGEILAISDREQQRLGQELHDGLCQHLTAVAFMARSIATRLKNHRVVDATDIEKIAQLVNDAASDTRDLSRALHRMDVDAAGLVTALQDLVDREIWRTPCRLQVGPCFRIDDDMAAAHLYRIAREAVINANKHAQAQKIVVKLENSRQGMALHVIDDGVGCSNESKLKQGLGFHIMNYRAQLMGGRLKIDSPKGGGTCVSCYLPDHAPGSGKPQENGQLKQLAAKSATAPAAVTVNFQHLEGLRAANS